MSDFSKAMLDALVARELAKPQAAYEQPAQEPPKKGVSKWAQLATGIGHGIDAGTTIHAMNTPGMVETNTKVYGSHPSTGRILGIKGGSAAIQMLLQHFLGKKSPNLANALGYGTGAAMGAVGALNELQIQKAKKANK